MTVVITRLDLSATDLREAAARAEDAKAARRMLAIALVLEGWARQAAAEACAMDRQTLRDWVIAIMRRGWTVCVTGRVAMGHRPGSPLSRRPQW